jgi:hypothetical protein
MKRRLAERIEWKRMRIAELEAELASMGATLPVAKIETTVSPPWETDPDTAAMVIGLYESISPSAAERAREALKLAPL